MSEDLNILNDELNALLGGVHVGSRVPLADKPAADSYRHHAEAESFVAETAPVRINGHDVGTREPISSVNTIQMKAVEPPSLIEFDMTESTLDIAMPEEIVIPAVVPEIKAAPAPLPPMDMAAGLTSAVKIDAATPAIVSETKASGITGIVSELLVRMFMKTQKAPGVEDIPATVQLTPSAPESTLVQKTEPTLPVPAKEEPEVERQNVETSAPVDKPQSVIVKLLSTKSVVAFCLIGGMVVFFMTGYADKWLKGKKKEQVVAFSVGLNGAGEGTPQAAVQQVSTSAINKMAAKTQAQFSSAKSGQPVTPLSNTDAKARALLAPVPKVATPSAVVASVSPPMVVTKPAVPVAAVVKPVPVAKVVEAKLDEEPAKPAKKNRRTKAKPKKIEAAIPENAKSRVKYVPSDDVEVNKKADPPESYNPKTKIILPSVAKRVEAPVPEIIFRGQE